MSDFEEQAWDEGFNDADEYLDHLMDEGAQEFIDKEYDEPEITDYLEFNSSIYGSRRYILCDEKVGDKQRFYYYSKEDYTVAEYDYIGECKYRFVQVKNNNKWGFFDSWEDKSGEYIEHKKSDIIFDEVGEFFFEKRNDKWKWSVEQRFYSGLLSVKKDGLWGFLNVDLKEIIACEYQDFKRIVFYPNPLNSGLTNYNSRDVRIIVKKNDKWGIIDSKNSIIIPFVYDKITKIEYPYNAKRDRHNKVTAIKCIEDKYFIFIDTDNIDEVVYSTAQFKSKQGNKVGLINCLGDEFIPCEFDEICVIEGRSFLLQSKKGDKIGLISQKGELLSCTYDKFDFSFREKNSKQKAPDKYYYQYHYSHLREIINRLINIPISLHPSDFDYIKYKENKLWGLLIIRESWNSYLNFKILFNPEFDDIVTRDYCDFITLKGNKWKIHFKFNGFYNSVYENCYKELLKNNNSHGISTYLNEEAFEQLTNNEFDDVDIHPLGYFVVKIDNKYGLIDKFGIGVKEGYYLLKPEFSKITIEFAHRIGGDNFLMLIKYDTNWGVRILETEKIILGLEGNIVTIVSDFYDYGLARSIIYKNQDKYGMVEIDSNNTLPCEYEEILVLLAPRHYNQYYMAKKEHKITKLKEFDGLNYNDGYYKAIKGNEITYFKKCSELTVLKTPEEIEEFEKKHFFVKPFLSLE